MKILVVEDHRALQEGVVNYLKEHLSQSISEILTASDGEEALRILKTQPIDYLITDLNLPKINGLDLIKEVRQMKLSVHILVLTMYYNESIISQLKSLDIQAFLTKNISLSEIEEAIKNIQSNKIYITPEIVSLYNNDLSVDNDHLISTTDFAKSFNLSRREKEVLKLLIENLSNEEIGEKIFVSKETVKSHRKNIYRKLGVNNVLDLYKLIVSNNIKL